MSHQSCTLMPLVHSFCMLLALPSGLGIRMKTGLQLLFIFAGGSTIKGSIVSFGSTFLTFSRQPLHKYLLVAIYCQSPFFTQCFKRTICHLHQFFLCIRRFGWSQIGEVGRLGIFYCRRRKTGAIKKDRVIVFITFKISSP